MVDARAVRNQHAHGRLRTRRAPRCRGDDDPRSLPLSDALRRVTVFVAPGCHLCDRALEVIRQVGEDVPFHVDVIDISSDAALEEEYRPWLPVVEIDGERAFTHFVLLDALRSRLV